jgi:hypothetical protein
MPVSIFHSQARLADATETVNRLLGGHDGLDLLAPV